MSRAQTALAHATAAGAAIRDGADPSGCITVILDDAGDAADILVATDWRRRLAADQVGAAVVAADQHAARRRAQATATALDRLPSLASTDSRSTVDDIPRPPAGVATVEPATGRRRSLTELTAAVWAAFDDLDRVTVPPEPARGAGAEGAVSITVAHGRVTACDIDPAWLTRQDEATLAHALAEALSSAGHQARRARAPLRGYQSHLDGLLADAMAHLGRNERGVDDDAAHRR
jgi:hypothetical protein